ncbi:helix-turn-helix domain-containing protein [Patescibacteria group bacterium]|nr:helix-turn-helix domain-containing protein [Patescibacteria group bacterium]MBU1721824.1 helix-turn-helix domain-containing protein [Patescibacteria group bacterium]MBU1901681.1 helix-turn-helix domain-containing protein [Patescibacteria group bacterium]
MTTDKSLQKKIQKLGLSDMSAQIYIFLLQSGGAYPSAIAKETKINRTTVYRILTDLHVKGLAVEVKKKNKLFYQLEPPVNLLAYTDMQIHLAQKRKKEAEQIFPDINALFEALPHKPTMRFFEGADQIVHFAYNDIYTQEGSYEICGWSNISEFQLSLPEDALDTYYQAYLDKGLSSRAFHQESEKYSRLQQRKTKYPQLFELQQQKYFKKDSFPYESQILIYGTDRVCIVTDHKETAVAFIIEDKIFHQMMKMIFNFSWDNYKE